VKEILDRNRSA